MAQSHPILGRLEPFYGTYKQVSKHKKRQLEWIRKSSMAYAQSIKVLRTLMLFCPHKFSFHIKCFYVLIIK